MEKLMRPQFKMTFVVLLVLSLAAVTWATIAQRKPVQPTIKPTVIKNFPTQSTQGELTIYDKEGKPSRGRARERNDRDHQRADDREQDESRGEHALASAPPRTR